MPHKATPLGLTCWGMILVGAIIVTSSGIAYSQLQPLSPAQTRSATAESFSSPTRQKQRVVTWRRRDTSNGPIFILTSDAPLDDYSSYVEGDRLFARIPQAALASAGGEVGEGGYADMRVEQRESDIVISVRVLQGVTVRVSQNFNRLEIIFVKYDQPND